MKWVITNGEDYWSNTQGWVEYTSADKFTTEETHILNLPIGGRWVFISRREVLADEYRRGQ